MSSAGTQAVAARGGSAASGEPGAMNSHQLFLSSGGLSVWLAWSQRTGGAEGAGRPKYSHDISHIAHALLNRGTATWETTQGSAGVSWRRGQGRGRGAMACLPGQPALHNFIKLHGLLADLRPRAGKGAHASGWAASGVGARCGPEMGRAPVAACQASGAVAGSGPKGRLARRLRQPARAERPCGRPCRTVGPARSRAAAPHSRAPALPNPYPPGMSLSAPATHKGRASGRRGRSV